jgi:exopolysaccharide production protein ExoZ
LQHVIGSYLFFPSVSAEGRLEPVVVVGWTLNFEMAFYLLFAVALALRWRPLWTLSPLLLLLPLTPIVWLVKLPFAGLFYFSTVLWEFVFGMVLATSLHQVRRLPSWWGSVLVLAGMYPLLTWNEPAVSFWRGLMWGLPALAVVAGAVILEKALGARSPRWALELGDASYSIYLIHTFTLPVVGFWVARWPGHWAGEIATAMTVALLLSVLSGEAVYRFLERPMVAWFKGRRQTAIPANR